MASPTKNLLSATTLTQIKNPFPMHLHYNLGFLSTWQRYPSYRFVVNLYPSVRFNVIKVLSNKSFGNMNTIRAFKAKSYSIITFPPVYKIYGSGTLRASIGLIWPSATRK